MWCMPSKEPIKVRMFGLTRICVSRHPTSGSGSGGASPGGFFRRDRKSVVVGKVTGVQTCALPISKYFRFTPPSLRYRVTGKAGRNRNAKAGFNVVHAFERTNKGQNVWIDKNLRKQTSYKRIWIGRCIAGWLLPPRSEERRCRESDWSSDVCSSDLEILPFHPAFAQVPRDRQSRQKS